MPEGLLLDPAPDLVDGVEAELHDMEGVEHPDRAGQVGAQRGVESDRGAVPAFRLVRLPGPLPEPDVRLPPHPALHVLVPVGQAASVVVPRSTAWGWPLRGSGSADGFSCRSQISDLTDRRPLHLAQVLALARRRGPDGPHTRRPEDAVSSPRASTAQRMARGLAAVVTATTAMGVVALGVRAGRDRGRSPAPPPVRRC